MDRMALKPACQKGITIPPRKEQPDELIKQAQQMVTR
jgi:GST-like protein